MSAGLEELKMMERLLGLIALVCCVTLAGGQLTGGQLASGGTTYYTSPRYCLTILSSAYQTCPPTYCYTANTRTQCCMGLYKSYTGSLYQQCKCTAPINCTPLPSGLVPSATLAPAATMAPAGFYYDTPLYCSSAPFIIPCPNTDACYYSTTRGSCCMSVQRSSGGMPQCTCSNPDLCLSPPAGR